MRANFPVTQNNYDFPGDELSVSVTNTKGEITHCNPAFARVSGFEYEDLIGQPHNLIRKPRYACCRLQRYVARRLPRLSVDGHVKNRRRNGDRPSGVSYATPIMEGQAPEGYLSVRTKPSVQDIRAAEALYADMNAQAQSGQETLRLRGGEVRRLGVRGFVGAAQRCRLAGAHGHHADDGGGSTMLPDVLGCKAWRRGAALGRASLLGQHMDCPALSGALCQRY